MNKRRDILGFVLLLGWISVVPGCGENQVPMLHRMTSYGGTLRITSEGASIQECDLAFDRRNGNLQAKFEDAGRVVTLVRGADGKPSAFEDAKERAATADEVARFELVRDLTDTRKLESVESGAKTYRIQRGGKWFVIELESQSGTRIHGHPR
jgi:hypothetical protein